MRHRQDLSHGQLQDQVQAGAAAAGHAAEEAAPRGQEVEHDAVQGPGDGARLPGAGRAAGGDRDGRVSALPRRNSHAMKRFQCSIDRAAPLCKQYLPIRPESADPRASRSLKLHEAI